MEAHRIAIISDTHGLLRPEIADVLKTCEIILHAGDIDSRELAEELDMIAWTYLVRGNMDREWAVHLPLDLRVELFGFQFYMVHNKKHIRADLSEVDFVIYGHSHRYEQKTVGDVVYLNPGSCGPRRFHQPVTMMVLTLYPEEHRYQVEKIDCSPVPVPAGETTPGTAAERDMDKVVREIIREMNTGRTVSEIALKNNLDPGFVEQICRIYATHPGVDIQGILNRMEIKDL